MTGQMQLIPPSMQARLRQRHILREARMAGTPLEGRAADIRMRWTDAERAVIRNHYAKHGAQACRAALPGRSLASIRREANALGIRWRNKPFKQRLGTRADHDALIAQHYANAQPRGAGKALARRIGRPAWYISHRAAELGLRERAEKGQEWSEAELELLDEHAHLSPQQIQKHLARAGYKRTQMAITVRRGRLRIGIGTARELAGLYNAAQLALLLGVERSAPARWIRTGLLTAKRRGTARAEEIDQYDITRTNIRKFITQNPDRIDLRRVNKLWFIEVLGGKA